MSLVPSCDTLYFTRSPVENLITLHYQQQSVPLPPFSTAVFKVKCSSPQLFHVVPCYGAVLLSNREGAKPVGYKGGNITFSLNQPHAARGEAGGVASSAAAAAATLHSERFCIEYYVLREEEFTYKKIHSSLSNPSQQAQAAKAAWSLISSNTLPKSHVSDKGLISLSVKVEGEEGSLEIPPAARLTTPSSRNETNGNVTGGESEGAGSPTNVMRGLKEAARSLKQEIRSEIQSAHEAEKKAREERREAEERQKAATADNVNMSSRGSIMAVCPEQNRETERILMQFKRRSKGTQKGVGVVPLMLTMIAVFFCAVALRSTFF